MESLKLQRSNSLNEVKFKRIIYDSNKIKVDDSIYLRTHTQDIKLIRM